MKQFLFFFVALATVCFSQITHHDLRVKLIVNKQQIQVKDTITLDSTENFTFVLHQPLNINRVSPGWKIEKINKRRMDSFGINSYFEELGQYWPLQAYKATNTGSNGKTLSIHYNGQLYSPPSSRGEQYTRSLEKLQALSFQREYTSPARVFGTPEVKENLISFKIQVETPKNWNVIAQGKAVPGKQNELNKTTIWDCKIPMEEIYIVGGPSQKYAGKYNEIDTLVYLRATDPGLANKYLQATSEYLEMYEKMLGEYPYSKFALVENFGKQGTECPHSLCWGQE